MTKSDRHANDHYQEEERQALPQTLFVRKDLDLDQPSPEEELSHSTGVQIQVNLLSSGLPLRVVGKQLYYSEGGSLKTGSSTRHIFELAPFPKTRVCADRYSPQSKPFHQVQGRIA